MSTVTIIAIIVVVLLALLVIQQYVRRKNTPVFGSKEKPVKNSKQTGTYLPPNPVPPASQAPTPPSATSAPLPPYKKQTRVTDNMEKNMVAEKDYDEVALGLSSPEAVAPKQQFTISFVAYPEEKKKEVEETLRALHPQHKLLMDVDNCRWQQEAEVTVRLSSTYLRVEEDTQTFIWRGKQKIVNFDVQALESAPLGEYINVRIDVLIAGISIAKLRMSIKVQTEASQNQLAVSGRPYKSAFASYAREDTNMVVGRLSEIERNGVKIFWDRLSLHTGEQWKPQLKNAIKDSEVFLLFWSTNAKASPWVEWEWKSALGYKGLDGIEPHPLEDPTTAPPPDELKDLHFDDKYLYFRKAIL